MWVHMEILLFKYVFIAQVQTQPRPRQGFGVQVFWSGFFVMLHWGTLGPTVNLFSTFSTLLKYKLYSFVCSCKNMLFLSFEV